MADQPRVEAVEGAGGDGATFRVACNVKDFGISEDKCLQLLAEHWNAEKAHPPWPIEQLQQKVENAYSYGQNPIGVSAPEAQFEAVELEATTTQAEHDKAPQGAKLFHRWFDEARGRYLTGAVSPLIDKYLGKGEMSVLYGDSNTGKTFVALDFAYHIATGQPWNGHKTNQGLAVYVAAEAGESINARLEALHRRYKPETEPPIAVVPCLVDLFSNNSDLRPLLELLARISAERGMPIVFVVLDTLARVIGTGDENSARDMGVLVKSVDRIRVDTGAHTQLVHHSGKNKANGARGSSALRAATDTELEIESGRIIMRKQRNGEIVKAIRFRLLPVDLGKDSEGDTVTSCTVDLGAAADFEPQLTHEQQEWLEQLKEYAAPLGLDELTYKQMQSAWSQPQRDLEPGFGSGVNKIAPCPISTTKLRATGLENSARLERVSKNGERPVRYRLAPDQSN
jgi:AAA domain